MELDNKILEEINSQMADKPLLILGEIHGASINPDIIDLLVKKLRILVVLFELENKWNKYLAVNNDGLQKFKKRLKSENWITDAGLLGGEHMRLLRELRKNGAGVVAVKVENKNWNRAEELTANKINRIISQRNDRGSNKRFLLVVGNLHARSQRFAMKIDNKEKSFMPLGAILRERSILVKVRYVEGKIKNFGIKNINDRKAAKFLGNKDVCIKKSRSKYFDYDLIVKRTNPVSEI